MKRRGNRTHIQHHADFPLTEKGKRLVDFEELSPEDQLVKMWADRCAEPSAPITVRPSSFCTVSTVHMWLELEVLLRSFIRVQDQPLLIICDRQTQQNVRALAKELETDQFDAVASVTDKKVRELRLELAVKCTNDFHKPEFIWFKMNAVERSVKKYGDVVFIDSDMIFFDEVLVPEKCEVAMFSHHCHQDPLHRGRLRIFRAHGVFNAGLVWTNQLDFSKRWQVAFERSNGFFEQSCMLELATEDYERGTLGWWGDIRYNFAAWRPRETLLQHIDNAKIVHVHLDSEIQARLKGVTRDNHVALRALTLRKMQRQMPDIYLRTLDNLGVPKKLLFIHYGKAGGVFVGEQILRKTGLLRSHVVYDGSCIDEDGEWFFRNYKKDELRDMIVSDDEHVYLHSHHIFWDDELQTLAEEHGWFTFSFCRHPADLLCSLYSWARDAVKQGLGNPMLEPTYNGYPQSLLHMTMTRSEFILHLLETEELHTLWRVPSWYHRLDYVSEFSIENVRAFLRGVLQNDLFGDTSKSNSSSNKGYAAHKAELSKYLILCMKHHKGYLEWAKHVNLTTSE